MLFGRKHKPDQPTQYRVFAYFPTQLRDGRWVWWAPIWRAQDWMYRDTAWSYFYTRSDRNDYVAVGREHFGIDNYTGRWSYSEIFIGKEI